MILAHRKLQVDHSSQSKAIQLNARNTVTGQGDNVNDVASSGTKYLAVQYRFCSLSSNWKTSSLQ